MGDGGDTETGAGDGGDTETGVGHGGDTEMLIKGTSFSCVCEYAPGVSGQHRAHRG